MVVFLSHSYLSNNESLFTKKGYAIASNDGTMTELTMMKINNPV